MQCKFCEKELRGKFCSNCGGLNEDFTDSVIESETISEAAAVPEEAKNSEEIKSPEEPITEEPEMTQAPDFSLVEPIIVAVAALFTCPLFNLVSIITAIISIINRNKMLSLFNEKRYNESMKCYYKAKGYFKWSWVSLIISVFVSIVVAATVFIIRLYQTKLAL